MPDTIKFALIGCGHIGLRHAAMIAQHPECRLVALCDSRPKETSDIAQFDLPYYQDIDFLLKKQTDCDVITIATPNGLHEIHALKALEAGKHVVIEKPMALTKASCERILFKALQKQKMVFCVMQNRYSPPSVWLKNLVDSGQLGRIFMVQINCYWNRDDRYYKPNASWHGSKDLDGGTLFTQFSHFVDLLYWCFGDITNIQARFADFKHQHSTDFEDSGFVHFDIVNGGMGSLNYSTAVWDKNMESSVTIIAENGSVKISGQYMEKIEYCHIKNQGMPILPTENTAIEYGNYKGTSANHFHVIQNIVDVLKGRNTITTNAMEGMKVVEIIDKIYALRSGY
jgi:UDP-N-acetyl-2-amino-2-deoxyglucuronate dehydrogenase